LAAIAPKPIGLLTAARRYFYTNILNLLWMDRDADLNTTGLDSLGPH